jgi:hypothetical protein
MVKSNELAVKEQTSLTTTDDLVYDYGVDSGTGFEGTSKTDLAIPFLGILQSNSPQVSEDNPKGAKAGLLFNTVTRELISAEDGIALIPVHKDHSFVEWVPREKGGGFIASHAPDSDVVKQTLAALKGARPTKLVLPNGNQLVETYYIYALLLNEEGTQSSGFCVISFTSTKIKPYRDWLTSMFMIKGRPPLFAFRSRLKSVKQKNEKGTFYNFQIEPFNTNWKTSLIDPLANKNLLEEAKSFREMVTSGVARAAFETQDGEVSSETVVNATSEELPF